MDLPGLICHGSHIYATHVLASNFKLLSHYKVLFYFVLFLHSVSKLFFQLSQPVLAPTIRRQLFSNIYDVSRLMCTLLHGQRSNWQFAWSTSVWPLSRSKFHQSSICTFEQRAVFHNTWGSYLQASHVELECYTHPPIVICTLLPSLIQATNMRHVNWLYAAIALRPNEQMLECDCIPVFMPTNRLAQRR